MGQYITYKYRIKNKSLYKKFEKMANSVNFVWNYCNQTSQESIKNHNKYLSGYDLNKLTANCSKELNITSSTIQEIGQQYAQKRIQVKKKKLNWRSSKRNLGWIPFKKQDISFKNNVFKYNKLKFKVWYSRKLQGEIKSGAITQDIKGNWFISIVLKINFHKTQKINKSVGIDLGIKITATCSNGYEINHNYFKQYENKLKIAQRAKKKKLIKNIYTKIKNKRKDYLHKETTKLVKNNDAIYVGNISLKQINIKSKNINKAILDNSWFMFKSMLEYKAKKLGIDYKEINEAYSSITCSNCLNKTKQFKGISGLSVREWTCEYCNTHHKRDVNAAKNILRLGCQTL